MHASNLLHEGHGDTHFSIEININNIKTNHIEYSAVSVKCVYFQRPNHTTITHHINICIQTMSYRIPFNDTHHTVI